MRKANNGWYRRGLTAVLCGALVAGSLTVTAFAEEGAENYCGPEVTWELVDGTLTISGNGYMDWYYPDDGEFAPWYDLRGDITTVVIERGVAEIGDFAFFDCYNLKEVYISDGLGIIGADAFENCWALEKISVMDLDAPGNGAAYTAVIPGSVEYIGADAFYSCGQLKDVYFLGDDLSRYYFDTEVDAETWRYDFSNPYGTKLHIPVNASLEDVAFVNVWNQQNPWQPPVAFDIAAEGFYAITVSQPGWGGKIAADKSGATEGEEVILTVTADEGLAATEVSVAYSSDGAAIALEEIGDGQYAFTMPAEDVTVSAAFAQAFQVTVREAEHGTVTVSKDKAAAGSLVAVEASADAGYVLDRVEFIQYGNLVKLDAAEDGKYYFEMPWADAEVVATFAKGGSADEGYHQISVKNDNAWAGTFTVDAASALEGEIISGAVNMTNDSFAGIINVYDADGAKIPVDAGEDGAFSFAMPGSDVTVELQLASYAYITAEQTEGGTIAVEKEKVIAGTLAYATVEPDKGYTLDSIVYNGYGAVNAEANGTYSFEVPSWGGNYSIKAIFVKDDSGEEKPEEPDWTCENGTLTISKPDAMKEFGIGEEAPWDEYAASVETLIVEEGVTTIGAFAFDNYPVLQEVILPNTLTSVGYQAFFSCEALERIEIPEGVTNICYGAFYDCNALKEVVLPSTLVVIEDEAFGECESLETINLPDGLEEIASAAFQSCASLTVLEIPASVVTIGEDAFFCCTGVSDVYFYATDFSGYGFEPYDMAEAFAGDGMTKLHILSSIDPSQLSAGNDIYSWYQANPANVVNDIA